MATRLHVEDGPEGPPGAAEEARRLDEESAWTCRLRGPISEWNVSLGISGPRCKRIRSSASKV